MHRTLLIYMHMQEERVLIAYLMLVFSRGVMCSAASSYICRMHMVAVRHSVRMTYRPSAALQLLGSLRISHKKFHV